MNSPRSAMSRYVGGVSISRSSFIRDEMVRFLMTTLFFESKTLDSSWVSIIVNEKKEKKEFNFFLLFDHL